MKLKYNEDKDTYSIKGLNVEHLQLIGALLNFVRLGSDSVYSDAAFDVSQLLALELGDDFSSDVFVYFTEDEGDVTIEVEEIDAGYEVGTLVVQPQTVEESDDISECTCPSCSRIKTEMS